MTGSLKNHGAAKRAVALPFHAGWPVRAVFARYEQVSGWLLSPIGVMVLLSFFIAGCGKPQVTEVAGRYSAKRPFGSELLTLQPDGSYVQVYSNSSGLQTNLGKWEYDPAEATLVLRRAWMFDYHLMGARTTAWYLDVSRSLSGLKLYCGDNDDPFYRHRTP
jgi:hypothetical protein